MVLGIEGRQFRPQFDTCCLGYFWKIHLSESHFPHPQSRGKYLSLIVLLRGYSNAQRAKEVVAMCGKEKWPPKDVHTLISGTCKYLITKEISGLACY